jgi:hypothetical protein
MKKITAVLGTTLVVAAVTATAALGSSSKPWDAVVGHYKTTAAAAKAESKLSGKGFSGFTTETEKRGQFSKGAKYELAKSFATQKQAKQEVAKLHKAGFKGASVENEKSEKTSG